MYAWSEGSDALNRFTAYSLKAQSLERLKRQLKVTKSNRGKQRVRWCIARCEDAMEAAWGEVDELSRSHGDEAAELVTRHYLWGEDWHDVTADMGLTYDKGKKMAYRAIKSLDGRKRESDV